MSKLIENTLVVDEDNATLRFRVSAGNGDYIKFPISFKTDRVTVIVPTYYNGAVLNICGVTKQGVCDRYGFTLSKYACAPGTEGYWNTVADPVDVYVIGEELNTGCHWL